MQATVYARACRAIRAVPCPPRARCQVYPRTRTRCLLGTDHQTPLQSTESTLSSLSSTVSPANCRECTRTGSSGGAGRSAPQISSIGLASPSWSRGAIAIPADVSSCRTCRCGEHKSVSSPEPKRRTGSNYEQPERTSSRSATKATEWTNGSMLTRDFLGKRFARNALIVGTEGFPTFISVQPRLS